MLFGSHFLIDYVKHKNWLWTKIRRSYRQLQLHQKELGEFLREPVNPSTPGRAAQFSAEICFQWGIILAAKFTFETAFCAHKLVTLSDLELILYREYLLFGSRIMESCMTNLARAGFINQEPQRIVTNFI